MAYGVGKGHCICELFFPTCCASLAHTILTGGPFKAQSSAETGAKTFVNGSFLIILADFRLRLFSHRNCSATRVAAEFSGPTPHPLVVQNCSPPHTCNANPGETSKINLLNMTSRYDSCFEINYDVDLSLFSIFLFSIQ